MALVMCRFPRLLPSSVTRLYSDGDRRSNQGNDNKRPARNQTRPGKRERNLQTRPGRLEKNPQTGEDQFIADDNRISNDNRRPGKDQRRTDNPRAQQTEENQFIETAQNRLNRTRQFRNMREQELGQARPTLNSYEELANIEMPVDAVAGILTRKLPKKQLTEENPETLTHRNMADNATRKFRKLAENKYYSEAGPHVHCPYTKELETRDYQAEDKLLRFPVDNEELVWEESHVPFEEHIFLHKYISVFPPSTQPFMETVISALQNNPDLTIEKKKQIIWNYLNYFNYYEDLLKEEVEEIIQV